MGCMHAAVLFESQNVIFFDDKMFSSGGVRSSCCARKIVSTVSIGHSSQWTFILSCLRIRCWAPQTLYFSLILYNRRTAATQGAHMHASCILSQRFIAISFRLHSLVLRSNECWNQTAEKKGLHNTAQCECVWDTRAAATHLRHNEMRTLNEMKDTYLSPLRYFLHHWIEKSSANIGLIWNASKNGGLDDSSSVEVRTEVWPHSVRRSHSYTPFR